MLYSAMSPHPFIIMMNRLKKHKVDLQQSEGRFIPDRLNPAAALEAAF